MSAPAHSVFPARTVTIGLVAVSVMLGAADLFLNILPGLDADGRVTERFYALQLNEELTAPAWFSSSLLLVAALGCAATWVQARRARLPHASNWLLLFFAFTFLSLDESVMVHERFGKLVGALFPSIESMGAKWTLVYGPAVIVFALVSTPFLMSLAKWLRNRIVGCGALFVAAAAGVELVATLPHGLSRGRGLTYYLLVVLEEVTEMVAISLFIGTLLMLLGRGVASGYPESRREPCGEFAGESLARGGG